MEKRDLRGLQVGQGMLVRVTCEVGVHVGKKDPYEGSARVGAAGGMWNLLKHGEHRWGGAAGG